MPVMMLLIRKDAVPPLSDFKVRVHPLRLTLELMTVRRFPAESVMLNIVVPDWLL
jgi:hypothetical protein